MLIGGSDADTLLGEAGDDVLDGALRDGAADRAEGGAGNDLFIWRPGAGNDVFHGGSGRDEMSVVGLSFEELRAGVQLSAHGAELVMGPDGTVSAWSGGAPMTGMSGTLRVGGEVLTFLDIERLRLAS